jgi:GNAT superfamily N-acetyltransferase
MTRHQEVGSAVSTMRRASMRIELEPVSPEDGEAVAALRAAVATDLTAAHGRGHWSSAGSAKGVLHQMRTGRVFAARHRGRVIASVCLGTRKPWAIDPSYFSPVRRALYLVDMAVAPQLQGRGIGRRCLAAVEEIARAWPAEAIRLDAYDGPVGAGEFYRRCGYREMGRVVYRGVPLVYYESLLRGPGEA